MTAKFDPQLSRELDYWTIEAERGSALACWVKRLLEWLIFGRRQ